jgi:subtilisin family serine protease
MNPLDLVKLTPLMKLSSGRAETKIALIDGPVVTNHTDLSGTRIHEIAGRKQSACTRTNSFACMHGTFVAGILSARRASKAPSIAPECLLLVRPIFTETASRNQVMPSATPEELATAIVDCVDSGAHVINLSAELAPPSPKGERKLKEALDYSVTQGTLVVAATGNHARIGSSAITGHDWVIPVGACDLLGRPTSYSNFGKSIGRRGLSAPGEDITSLGTDGPPLTLGGTSAAAPFVTGCIALLLSIFPKATATSVKLAVTQGQPSRRTGIVPALLDAWAAYRQLENVYG